LKETASSFPSEFANQRVLPSLISALEFGGVSAAAILPLVLQFGSNTPPDSYNSLILAPLIKLFASPDRGTRMALLEHLPEYVDKLDKKSISDKIFPHLVNSNYISMISTAQSRFSKLDFPIQCQSFEKLQ
jgi:SCY1-like protein 1